MRGAPGWGMLGCLSVVVALAALGWLLLAAILGLAFRAADQFFR